MSFQALNNALTGLRIAQQQLSVISNNVANATTPGYSRKILPQSTQVVHNTGEVLGVRSDTLIRKVDLNLERELWTKVSSVSALDVKAAYLDTIEKFHGATNKEMSIAAEIAALKDKFAALSDSPADGFLIQDVLSQAGIIAGKFNDYGKMITQMRNDAQDEMIQSVARINELLSTISTLNREVKYATPLNRTTAAVEDMRDQAVNELASLMNITFFTRGDGVMVIQTTTGTQLVDENTTEVFFKPGFLDASSSYPHSAAGIYVGGDPAKNAVAVDITNTNVGGKLGGLIELRDDILIRYQTQMDELAHKTALRMEQQGLRLFTDNAGTVPADTPPDPAAIPPVSVSYVGFASLIQVNRHIHNNPALIQQGTYESDRLVPEASNEVIRRVIQYGFGNISHQEAAGTMDLNFGAPATDLQSWLGLYSTNNVVGGIDLTKFSQIDDGLPGAGDIATDLSEFFPAWPGNDSFQITLEEPRLGLGPVTLTISLSAAQANHPPGPGITNALDQIVAEINAQITTAGLPPEMATSATSNSYGQLMIQSRANVELTATGFADAMGPQAFAALGLQERAYHTEDPYFDIQIGNNDIVRIAIEPGDDINDLIDKLEYNAAAKTGVPGLHVDFDAVTGQLTLRPGMSNASGGPRFGGDLRIVSGPGLTAGAVNPALAALPGGVSVVGALFGNFSVSGGTIHETTAVRNVEYGSETFAGSGEYVSFRSNYLGPAANIGSKLIGNQSVTDFAMKLVNSQAQDVIMNDAKRSDEATLRDVISQRFLNETGVNVDEELSMLIVVQTAYAAAARAVSAADEMFAELLNAMR